MGTWVYDPHSGGVKIPENVKQRTTQRILAYAEKHYAGKYKRIDVRFKAQFCYIDAYIEPYIPDNFDPSRFRETREEFYERVSNRISFSIAWQFDSGMDDWYPNQAPFLWCHRFEQCEKYLLIIGVIL
jgi:hypothetical protein